MKIKNRFCFLFKPLKWIVVSIQLDKKLKVLCKTRTKRFLLVLTPQYGNLGDHCIAMAELQYFRDNYSNYKVDEIPFDQLNPLSIRIIKKYSKNYSAIFITGGGFIGSLWKIHDKKVNIILNLLKKNKIIIFPQTFFYFNDKEYNRRINTYLKCKQLVLCVRDESYNSFENRLNYYSIPDMVLYLNYSNLNLQRKGILLCFRNDKEKISNTDDIYSKLKNENNDDILITDTVLPHKVCLPERQIFVENKIREFASSELVITDRLHGMLLAVITGTPCIAMNNISRKVEGVYNKWLQNFKYIKVVNSAQDITLDLITSMKSKKSFFYDNNIFKNNWKLLNEVIEN